MIEKHQNKSAELTEEIQHETQPALLVVPITPALLPLTSLRELFDWYKLNLCDRAFTDPRGYRVSFEDTDFVHLIKLTNKYGKEPRNARMTIEQIQSERIVLHPGRLDIRRVS